MTIGLLIAFTLFGALLYSGKQARGSAPFVNGTGYIDTHLVGFRQHVNKVRSAKCLSRYPYQRSDAYLASLDIGSPQRRFMRLIWKVRHWRAHAAPSRCAPAIDHRWLWECVHSHEGAWNDSGDPYFGGLQMGRWFMATYAPRLYATKGTADNWTPAEQMQVAGNAYHSAGHSSAWLNGQWPGTLSECGA